MKEKNDWTNAMGKTFILTAQNENGDRALREIFAQKDTPQESVIMKKGLIQKKNKRFSIYYEFTNAARLMSKHKGMKSKFEPFTVANVCERIIKNLKEYEATLTDVEIEVRPGGQVKKDV